jgi:hypothetical protein
VAQPDRAADGESSPDPRGSFPARAAGTGHSGDLHQTLLREVNERIEQLNGSWASDGADGILCECGHPGSLEKIEIAAAAYERVRATLCPGLSSASNVNKSSTVGVGLPPIDVMTSPTWRPAFSPGPPGMTLATSTPLPFVSAG